MEQALVSHSGTSIVNIEDFAMSVDGLVAQVHKIQQYMEKVMKEDEHYGTIPGTKKPTLLKPGAEKLCLAFRLDPNYEIIREVRDKEFIAYTIKCDLTHIPTRQSIASGIGSCNSRETKYRYRYIEEATENAVPKSYWAARENGDSKEMKRLLGGEGFRAAKIDGQWVIAKSTQVENDNPWDLDNTLIKMACKRALVAATLNATAASDIFTQDVEDMAEILDVKIEKTAEKAPKINEKQEEVKEEKFTNPMSGAMTDPQRKKIYAMLKGAGLNDIQMRLVTEQNHVHRDQNPTKADANHFIDNFDTLIAEYRAEGTPF